MRSAIVGTLFACIFSSGAFAAASVKANGPSEHHAAPDQPTQVPPAAPNSGPAAFTPHTVQAPSAFALNAPAAGSANTTGKTVTACHNSSVFGAVLSPKAILLQGFTCFKDQEGSAAPSVGSQDIALGGCPLASTTDAHKAGCEWDVALNVQFANPADADKMKRGRLVRLGGKFVLVKRQQADYVTVQNAKIQFLDYFWSSRPNFAGAAPSRGPGIAPFYTAQPPSMPAGNSASGIPFGQIAGIGN
jgi:hypothetical protein